MTSDRRRDLSNSLEGIRNALDAHASILRRDVTVEALLAEPNPRAPKWDRHPEEKLTHMSGQLRYLADLLDQLARRSESVRSIEKQELTEEAAQ